MANLKVGGTVGVGMGGTPERLAALEAAVVALDAALDALAERVGVNRAALGFAIMAHVEAGTRTPAVFDAVKAIGVPAPPPLPSTAPSG
jgi:hypothetical protein